jgi:hypothetical protein
MVPAALPAASAPTGVNSAPSFAASASDTLAITFATESVTAATLKAQTDLENFIKLSLY